MALNMLNFLRFLLFNRRHKMLPPPTPDRRDKFLPMNCKEANRFLKEELEKINALFYSK